MKRINLKEAQVRALLDGAKEIRVEVRPEPVPSRIYSNLWHWPRLVFGPELTRRELLEALIARCPYPIGSLVALTETWKSNPSSKWAREHQVPCLVSYKADDDDDPPWRSPATMPAEFSRFIRRVKDVRVGHGEQWEWVLTLEEVKHGEM